MAYFPSVAFLTGSVGTGEWIVLFVVVLIVVGPKRLPEIARKIGRTMEMFRRAADEFKDQLMTMDQEPPAALPQPGPADPSQTPNSEESSVTTDSYDNLYPDTADYPGNEGQVENWSSDQSPDVAAAEFQATSEGAEKPPEGGA